MVKQSNVKREIVEPFNSENRGIYDM